MEQSFDLHTHTMHSDGTLRPSALVRLAARRGIGLAVTDHDSVEGVAEALEAGRRIGVTILPGIELSVGYKGREAHILGLFVDHEHAGLVRRMAEIKAGRYARATETLRRLSELGYPLAWRDFSRRPWNAPSISLHLIRALAAAGIIQEDEGEAFKEEYLAPGAPAHVPRVRVDPEEAVSLISSAGGVPVLAHPGWIPKGVDTRELIALGMEGLEAFHPEHGAEDCERLVELAREHGLLVTGGSDYHGHGTPGEPDLGAIATPLSDVLEIARRARSGFARGFLTRHSHSWLSRM